MSDPHRDDKTIAVCPECESSDIRNRVNNHVDGSSKWYCNPCDRVFDEAKWREPEHDYPNRLGGGLAAKLDELDADDVLSGGAP